MKVRVAALLIAVGSLCGGRVYAHHSFASTYIENQQTSVEGEVVQFVYRNPHAILQIVSWMPIDRRTGGRSSGKDAGSSITRA